MDELSNLIKEARPLYKARKRRKAIAKMIFMLTVPMILTSSIYQICLTGDNLYLSLKDNSLQTELMEDEFELLGL